MTSQRPTGHGLINPMSNAQHLNVDPFAVPSLPYTNTSHPNAFSQYRWPVAVNHYYPWGGSPQPLQGESYSTTSYGFSSGSTSSPRVLQFEPFIPDQHPASVTAHGSSIGRRDGNLEGKSFYGLSSETSCSDPYDQEATTIADHWTTLICRNLQPLFALTTTCSRSHVAATACLCRPRHCLAKGLQRPCTPGFPRTQPLPQSLKPHLQARASFHQRQPPCAATAVSVRITKGAEISVGERSLDRFERLH